MPKRPTINTKADLIQYVHAVLGDRWTICLDETDRLLIDDGTKPVARRVFSVIVILTTPFPIRAAVTATNLRFLINAVHTQLWERIRDEFEKYALKWDCSSPQVIAQRLCLSAPQLLLKSNQD